MKKWMLIITTVLLVGCAEKRYSTTNELCQEITRFSSPNWTIYSAPQFNKILQEERLEERRKRLEEKRKKGIDIGGLQIPPFGAIRITVEGRPDLVKTVTLNNKGEFNYIFNIRNVKAVGLFHEELRDILQKKLSSFIQNPAIVLNQLPTGTLRSPLYFGKAFLIEPHYSMSTIPFYAHDTFCGSVLTHATGLKFHKRHWYCKYHGYFLIRKDWKTKQSTLIVIDLERMCKEGDLGDFSEDIALKRHDILCVFNSKTEEDFNKQLKYIKALMKKVGAAKTYKELLDTLKP